MRKDSKFSPSWSSDCKYAWLLTKLRSSFNDFAMEIRLPMLGPNLTKGSFSVNYDNEQYALPQCYTLLVTAKTCALGNCFCIQRAFRANDQNSHSHLREFDILECGMSNTSSKQAMNIIENILNDILFEVNSSKSTQLHFPQISWNEINASIDLFQPFDDNSPDQQDFSHLLILSEPIFLTNLPWTRSSWASTMVAPGVTTRFNLLAPQVGEIAEGGERLLDGEYMRKLFIKIGLLDYLGWYADALSSNVKPVTVFALGIERLACWLFGYKDIRMCHSCTQHPGC